MKNIKLLGSAAAMFALALTSGCTETLPGKIIDANFAFISESSAVNGLAYEKIINATATDVQFDFSIELVDYAVQDEVLTLNVENAVLVSAYNDDNDTDYTAVAQSNITFSGTGVSASGNTVTVTVPAESNRASVTVNVTKFSGMEIGKEYAVAMKLSGASNNVIRMAPGSWSTMLFPIVLLNKTLDELDLPGSPIAPSRYAMFTFPNNDTDYTLSTNRWGARFADDITLECWLFVPNFNGLTPAVNGAKNTHIFDNKKASTADKAQAVIDNTQFQTDLVDEYFARFSTSSNGGMISDTEIKSCNGAGAYVQGWKADQWLHLAIVFKRRDNVFVFYRNGEQVGKVTGYPEPLGTPTEGNPFDKNNTNPRDGKLMFAYLNMFGTHSGGFSGMASVRELRMWNVARRPSQIAKYMRMAVDVNEPNLVGYWPMSQATYDDTATVTLPTSNPPGVNDGNYINTGFAGQHFANIATFEPTADIPATPDMKVGTFRTFNNSIYSYMIKYGLASWSDADVNFATTPVTLKDGTEDTGATTTRAAVLKAVGR